jgi:hypothetical protein
MNEPGISSSLPMSTNAFVGIGSTPIGVGSTAFVPRINSDVGYVPSPNTRFADTNNFASTSFVKPHLDGGLDADPAIQPNVDATSPSSGPVESVGGDGGGKKEEENTTVLTPETSSTSESDTESAASDQASVPYNEKIDLPTTNREVTPWVGTETQSEAEDFPLSSITEATITDLISEGPVEGFCDEAGQTIRPLSNSSKDTLNKTDILGSMKSIFLDDTPVQSKGGQVNFRRFSHQFRNGLPIQNPMMLQQGRTVGVAKVLLPNNRHSEFNIPSELVDSGNPTVDQKEALNSDFALIEGHCNPITHTITDLNVTQANITINIHALTRNVTGKRSSEIRPHEIKFLIYAGNEGDEGEKDFYAKPVTIFVPGSRFKGASRTLLFHNDTGGYFVRRLKGLATMDYLFDTIVHFPPNPRRRNRIIRVSRLDPDADFTNMKDVRQAQASLRSVTEIVPYKMMYPSTCVVNSFFDSRAYSTIPRRNYLMKLQKVKVPSNYLPDTKKYSGNWDGRFKTSGSFLSSLDKKDYLGSKPYIHNRNAAIFKHTAIADFSSSSKGFKIDTGTKYSGAGSLRFFQESDKSGFTDKVIKVYDDGAWKKAAYGNKNFSAPGAKGLGMASFGDQNFTMEFNVKINASELKKIYKVDGTVDTSLAGSGTEGLAGVSRTIIASDNNFGLGVINSESEVDADTGQLSDAELESLATKIAYGGIGYWNHGIAGGGWKLSVETDPAGVLVFQHFVSHINTDFVDKISHEEMEGEDKAVYTWDKKRYKAAKQSAIDSGTSVPRRFNYGENIKLTSGSTSIADNAWHHVCIMRNGNTIKMFIDGTEQTQAAGVDDTHAENLKKGLYGVTISKASRASAMLGRGELQIGGTRTPRVTVGGENYETTFVGHLDNLHIAYGALYSSGGPSDDDQANIKNGIDSQLYMPFDSAIDDVRKAVVDMDYLLTESRDTGMTVLQWTDNPAWIYYDLATNPRYGMGKYGVKESFVDKWSLYEIAKYCDDLVRTGWASSFNERSFDFVDDDPGLDPASSDYSPSNIAGTSLMRIKGFSNQKQFETEFPEGKIINIYNLNDKKTVAYQRQIRYLRSSTGDPFRSDISSDDDEVKGEFGLLSYQDANPENEADAIIRIIDVISVEDALERHAKLGGILYSLKKRYPNVSDRELIFSYMLGPSGRNSTTQRYWDVGKKINDVSESGSVCCELNEDHPFLEPRFTANIYIDGVTDGIRVLNDIASIFRGITYYAGGRIIPAFDKKRDPITVFTNSNVTDGNFIYTGSSKSDRFTVCKVRFNDKKDKYKQRIEFIEDSSGIIKYGYNEKDLAALGCTSRGQARRLGRWFLYSAQHETETIKFSTSKIATYLRPGDVFRVMDKNRTSEKNFGKVVGFPNSGQGKLQLKLDSEINTKYVGQKITVTISQKFKTVEDFDYLSDHNYITSEQTLGIETSKISDEEIADMRKVQLHEFTIKNIQKDTSAVPNRNTIIELESTDPEDVQNFGSIRIGAAYSIQRLQEDIKIKEDMFRVINIKQVDNEEYELEGLEYNDTKHETVDFFKEVEKTRERGLAEVAKPTKMTNPPKLNIITGDDPQHRKVLVSWDPVTPAPYGYAVVLEIYPGNFLDWSSQADVGDTAEFSEFGVKSMQRMVKAENDDGNILPTNVQFNIGSYFGEVVVRIYTVDSLGNVELVYF